LDDGKNQQISLARRQIYISCELVSMVWNCSISICTAYMPTWLSRYWYCRYYRDKMANYYCF